MTVHPRPINSDPAKDLVGKLLADDPNLVSESGKVKNVIELTTVYNRHVAGQLTHGQRPGLRQQQYEQGVVHNALVHVKVH